MFRAVVFLVPVLFKEALALMTLPYPAQGVRTAAAVPVRGWKGTLGLRRPNFSMTNVQGSVRQTVVAFIYLQLLYMMNISVL